jgi:hypothetical protein
MALFLSWLPTGFADQIPADLAAFRAGARQEKPEHFAMNALRIYWHDFLNSTRQVGGLVGGLMMLLSVPGILAPALPSDWAHAIPWLPFALAGVSAVLMILGLGVWFCAVRDAWRFGLRLRIRRRP